MLLQKALHTAVGRAYVACQPAHPAHVAFAEQQRQRHDEKQHARKPHVEARKNEHRSGKPEKRHDYRRHCAAHGIRHRHHVLFKAVEHVAGVQRVTTGPLRAHQMRKQLVAQSVAEAYLKTAFKPSFHHRQQHLHGYATEHQPDVDRQFVIRMSRHDVNQVLADVYERQRHCHVHDAGQRAP